MATCIIGMYYNKGRGLIVVSDSRELSGRDYQVVQKLFRISEHIVMASSGYTGMANQLVANVLSKLSDEYKDDLPTFVRQAEKDQTDFWYYYKSQEKPKFQPTEPLIEGMIAGYFEGKPQLFVLEENGYADMISPHQKYTSIGDGSRFARSVIDRYYSANLAREQALEICVHAIVQTAKFDTVVDDKPQVAILEDGNCETWNIDQNGDFRIDDERILAIKKKINGIENKQALIFNLMMSNNETVKKKLDETLNEYQKVSGLAGVIPP
ncbi:MAG: hypothetical protein ACLQEQ_06790 [Nitrososphaerales archaeon]